ncbi:MAG: hypothetical protein WC314_03605 [Vulcanimicrobiota bacterium]
MPEQEMIEDVLLPLVQVANLWQAGEVRVEFEGGLKVEIRGAGDRREWLEGFVERLRAEEVSPDPGEAALQKAVRASLDKGLKKVVLAAAGPADQEPRAVRLEASKTLWGQARLEPESFLLLLELPGPLPAKLPETLQQGLERYCCSDRTRVFCGPEIKAFRRPEPGLSVGLWAWADEKGGVPLGESFKGVDEQGLARNELTFGTFRTCLMGKGVAGSSARSVLTLTQHKKPVPSRAIWLWQGTRIAHHDFDWPCDTLALTLFLAAPKDTVGDPLCREDRMEELLEQACRDIQPSLEMLVGEYNRYTPRIERSTMGCWTLLLAGSLALAGVAAPWLGGKLAFWLGGLTGVALIVYEYRSRHRERYSVGRGLQRLLEAVEDSQGQRVWKKFTADFL